MDSGKVNREELPMERRRRARERVSVKARRLAGLLTGLLMLHLTLVGASLTCVQHGDHGVSGEHMSGHHMRPIAASSSTPTNPQHETPAQPECCRAMTSCVVVAIRSDAQSRDLPPSSSVIEAALMHAPHSPLTPPDPPPPRV